MALRLSTKQLQKQVLAPSMQQSIEVLLLPITELSMAIDQEIQENPLLEIDEERLLQEKKQFDDFIHHNLRHHFEAPTHRGYDSSNDDETLEEKPVARGISLEEHLLHQLKFEFTSPLDIAVGELIIGNLDEDGFLKISLDEIAEELNLADIAAAERVLKKIHLFDPLGIASRNLKECLLIQAQYNIKQDSDLIEEIITSHLDEVAKKNFHELARKLKTPEETIKEACQIISKFEPRPARNFRPLMSNIYIKPDIIIRKRNEKTFEAVINDDTVPPLRISQAYQKLLHQANRTPEEAQFIRDKIKQAILFMKSIEQRNQTIREITQFIIDRQKEFLVEGIKALKPMTLKDVAESIQRNESTVSRAINNKYMDTPQGLLPMKFFFSQGLDQKDGQAEISNECVKDEILTIVEEEDKSKPLSDEEILKKLKQRGYTVARRTISKYRKHLKILPSHLRKN